MAVWVGQFGIEGGHAREVTPWVGAYPDPGRAEDGADLYVLLQPALPGSEEFLAEMKDAIGESFHRSRISLTGGILRALQEAHTNLRDWNRRSLQEHRVAAGVSCLALRGDEAYLAQAGPAAAVLYRDGTVTVFRPALADAREALGLFDDFRPEFRRFDLEAGDRILLLSPALADGLSESDLAAVLVQEGEDALPDLYRRARDLPDCGALLVAAVAGAVEEHESMRA